MTLQLSFEIANSNWIGNGKRAFNFFVLNFGVDPVCDSYLIPLRRCDLRLVPRSQNIQWIGAAGDQNGDCTESTYNFEVIHLISAERQSDGNPTSGSQR